MPNTTEKVDDLEVLFPGRRLNIAGGVLLITPFKLTQVPRVAALFARYYAMTAEPRLATDPIIRIDPEKLILAAGDDVWEIMCMATGKDRVWLDGLSANDGVDLLKAIIEENADFFIKKLAPTVTVLSEKVMAGAQLSKH